MAAALSSRPHSVPVPPQRPMGQVGSPYRAAVGKAIPLRPRFAAWMVGPARRHCLWWPACRCGRRGSCGRRDRLILAAGISRGYWNSGNRRNCAPRRWGRERCRMLLDSRRRRRKPDGSRRFFRSLSSIRIGIGRISLRDRRPRRRGPRWRCLGRGCLGGLLLPPRVPAFLMGRLISLVVPMGSCWRRSIRGCKAGGILRTRRAGAQASAGQHGERRCSQKMRSCLCHHEVPTPFQWRAQSSRRIRREYVKYPQPPEIMRGYRAPTGLPYLHKVQCCASV